MKKCSRCKDEKPEVEFSFKNKSLGLLHIQCKKCVRSLVKEHYNKNKDYYLFKTRNRNNKIRLETLSYINNYLISHPCKDCGESDITVLEFDHTGEKPKLKAVSSLIRERQPLQIIKEEIDKCEVRCANCHKRKTAVEFNWSKNNKRL